VENLEAIYANNLVKTFGKLRALDGLSIQIEAGDLYCLLGPNGAGKSTLIRVLIGLMRPTSGTVRIDGIDLSSGVRKVREVVGLVSEKVILYDKLSPIENLLFFASMKNIPKKKARPRILELLDRVDMLAWKDKPIRVFSTGMRQRINFIRALVHSPKIVFMDEPTIGLDPHTTRTIRNMVKELNNEGTTVVLTTHMMHEVENISSYIGIMNRGRIIANGSIDELKNTLNRGFIRLTVSGRTDVSLEDLEGFISVRRERDSLIVEVEHDTPFDRVIEGISYKNLTLLNVEHIKPSLEDVFVEMTISKSQTLDTKSSERNDQVRRKSEEM
jgi:ABC-2 type transport system ATP-binding protein